MKKLFLLGALLCASNFSSAYGGYYGLSSDDLIAIQVILLIWSVLCLILFFKIFNRFLGPERTLDFSDMCFS